MTDTPIAVSAGILWRGDLFLACEKIRGPYKHYWEFPGGKLEPYESPREALIRELQEELGITVTEARFWQSIRHSYPEMSVIVHFFHVHAFLGEPRAQEGQTIRWIHQAEALALPFLEADTAIVHDIAAYRAAQTKGRIGGLIDGEHSVRNIHS